MNSLRHGLSSRWPIVGRAFLFAVPLVTLTSLAQTVAPAPTGGGAGTSAPPVAVSAAAAEEEAIELSPFVITAEEDSGYQATSSLSGTRLRTDMRDIAASVSVITKEFMDDLAVDGLEQLASYTLGTEIGGLDGNFSDAQDNGGGFIQDDATRRGQSAGIVRVRGLDGIGAQRTRDFFLTDTPGDSYNTERLDIQRGPNGMLYGLASPAGSINEGASRANLNRERTNISTRVDSFRGYRGQLDHNHVLIKDRLGVRFSTVYNKQRYQIEEAYNFDRRAYGTISFRPLNSTLFKVSAETALIRANPPRTLPPLDRFSYWWDVGKPVYDASTGTATYLGTPSTNPNLATSAAQFTDVNTSRASQPTLIIEDPATGEYGLSIPGNPMAAELVANRVRRVNNAFVNDGVRGLQMKRLYLQQLYAVGTIDRNFWLAPTLSDGSIFDFFHHQLDGDSRYRDSRWHNLTVSLEQQLGRHAGLEVSYFSQNQDEAFGDWPQFNRYYITLDVTTKLIDGTPNPNFGRPYFADAYIKSNRNRDRQAFRATAYYDLDFKRFFNREGLLAKLLGRHVFTGNYTRQTNEINRFFGNPVLDLNYWAIEQSANPTTPLSVISTGQRSLNVLAYLGPSMANLTGPQNNGLQTVSGNVIVNTPKSVSLYNYLTPPASATTVGTWQIQNFNVVDGASEWDTSAIGSQATHTREVFRSASLVSQDRWFENTVVTTAGIRRDWVKTWDAGGAQFDPVTGQPITDPSIFALQSKLNQHHDAFNYGVVVHTPEFIQRWLPRGVDVSLSFNHSDNFTPQAERLNVYGVSLDPTEGKTEEFGAIIGLFDRRIQMRLAHYETASALATSTALNGPILDMDRNMFQNLLTPLYAGQITTLTDKVTDAGPAIAALKDFMRSPAGAAFYSTLVTGYYIDPAGNLQGSSQRTINRVFATTDYVAKGWELETTANPLKSWRITFNVANQTTVRSNTGDDLAALLDSWRPYIIDGIAGLVPFGPSATATTTLRDRYNNTWLAPTRRNRALDGSKSPELRQWRFNVVNNYTFSEGRLRGWNLGGALRWQDKVAIGYPIINVDGAGVYDVHHPYWGPTETNVDGWIGYSRRVFGDKVRWKAQLNARNIGVHNKLIPVSTQPDGSINTYRVTASSSWSLTNSFEF